MAGTDRADPVKLLIVTHYMPPHHGGIERIAEDQAATAAAAGFEVTWAASRVPVSAPARERTSWGTAVRVPAWNPFEDRLGVPLPLWRRAAVDAVRALVAASDLVHVHDVLYPGTSIALAAARKHGRPALLTQHVGFVPMRHRALDAAQRLAYRTVGRRNARRAHAVAWYSENARAWLAEACGVEPRVYLPNAVDAGRFRPARDEDEKRELRRRHRLPLHLPVVLFVGRLVPKKGADLVVEAAQPGSHTLLVGERGAVDIGDRPGIELRGFVERAELAELLRAADVLALPSVGEGFPLVAQEAMASGLAVVLADDPALRAAVEADAAVFVPPRAADLGGALRRLVDDAGARTRLGVRARRCALERWGEEACRARLLAAYAALTAQA